MNEQSLKGNQKNSIEGETIQYKKTNNSLQNTTQFKIEQHESH
jgi:hypothetical protein